MPRSKLSRRTLLKGILGGAAVTVGLPTLEVFLNTSGTAYADGTAFPKRFGLFFWGNGVLPDKWNPAQAGEGDGWSLSEQLAPLESIKHKISVVSGTTVQVPNNMPHGAGPAGLFSGSPLLVEGRDYTFQAPSIDQIIAAETGKLTRFKSIEIAASAGDGLSYLGKNSKNPPEHSPAKLFERIFGGSFQLPGDEPVSDPTLRLRRSVLDAVSDDLARVQAKVGTADRQRLDQHLTGIRELEQRLTFLEENPPSFASCALPTEPEAQYTDVEGRTAAGARSRAMAEVMALALACDQTRVFSQWFSKPVGNLLFPGANSGHHQLTHDEPGDQPQVNAIVIQIIEELAWLLNRLDQVPEGDATLLDHCLVLGTTDCSYGRLHSLDEYPLVLAGGAGGAIKMNMHYRPSGAENASKVMLSIIRAMGLTAPSFGTDDAFTDTSLTAIEA